MNQAEHHRQIIQERLAAAREAINALGDHDTTIEAIAEAIAASFNANCKVLTCGNGGSAAEALHLAEEFIGRFSADRPPLPAICLNADPTALTCIGNDYGFDQIFSRQCEALAQRGDVLIVLSTSGASANIINALRAARARGAHTIGLLGGNGGQALALCDIALLAPGSDSAAIQECHQVVLHAICNCFEPKREQHLSETSTKTGSRTSST